MTDIASTVAEVAGAALIVVALWLIWMPLALFAAGCGLLAGGYLAGKPS